MRPALSSRWWRTRADPVPSWARLNPNDRTLSWVQTEAAVRGERQPRPRTIVVPQVQGTDYPSLGDYSGVTRATSAN